MVRSDHPDAARSRLRGLIAAIELDMATHPRPLLNEDGSTNTLLASWAKLVDAMALGPEPEVRECPHCEHLGMKGATRCSNCWNALTPS